MNNDWNNIRFFLAVIKTKSIADAAKLLKVNHTTVFRRINTFEEECGVKLFNRLSTGYELTTAGKEVEVSAREVEAKINSFDRLLAEREMDLSGHIRLITVDGLMPQLQRDLVKLCDLYPHIEVELIVGGGGSVKLDGGEAHIAILPLTDPPEHLIGRKLGASYVGLYCAMAYQDRLDEPITEDNLAEQKFVLNLRQPNKLRSYHWLEKNRDKISVNMSCHKTGDQLSAIRSGIGIGWLPVHLASEYKDLIQLDFFPVEPAFDIWMLTHPDSRGNQNIASLTQFFLDGYLSRRLK